ncbi:MAG TPA: sodium/solute symporter [Vicinamibacterales bacterium]|jgi:SSS family solute:Na+ symporter
MPHITSDVVVFGLYLLAVASVGWLASRRRADSEGYFLASRNLTWPVIGGSMIAANISTHHFIGMSGRGYEIGLAIASFEWMAAIALVLYGWFFLPYYLKSRITTMPEFLQRRFDGRVRTVYAIISLIGYIVIELAVVLYTGSLAIREVFGLPLPWGLAILCVVGGGYAIVGGFKAVAYTDVIQVTVLILGGLTVTWLGLHRLGVSSPGYQASPFGGMQALMAATPEKFHMVRPWNDPELPWIGVFFGGMWLANIFYWGCNQFITQRTLSAKDVWHGQMGVIFAGFLKLLVPLLVVLPGMIAFRLYNPDTGLLKAQHVLTKGDLAFPTLVTQLLPAGLTGLVMAGLMGCVMSHIASMVVASSSIITFDIYKNHVKRDAASTDLVRIGRLTSLAVLVAATIVGYFLRDLRAIFLYIQKYWSIAYPSVCALFLAGFFYKRATARGALIAIIVGPAWALTFTIAEGWQLVPSIPFLTRAVIDFIVACVIIWIYRTRGDEIPEQAVVDRSFSPEVAAYMKTIPWWMSFPFWGTVLVLCVVALYVRFL